MRIVLPVVPFSRAGNPGWYMSPSVALKDRDETRVEYVTSGFDDNLFNSFENT
ncbi:MAG: hypothetical protein GX639_17420 [Fibrobacter sp.]|nr:hypothetical protein [Fibrobacter sp.]